MKKPVIFLSAVSPDFEQLRDIKLRNVLSQFDVEVKVQPAFKTGAEQMLIKLENLVNESDHVIALVGRKAGLVVENMDLQPDKYSEILADYPFDKLSLTQWEQLFAHRAGKLEFLCIAEDEFFPDAGTEDSLQLRWKKFLLDDGLILDRLYFNNDDNLISQLRGIDRYQSMLRGELQPAPGQSEPTLDPSQQSVLKALKAGAEPKTDDILGCRNPKQVIDSVDKYLLQRWAYWAAPQAVLTAGRLHYQFVPLHITLDLQRLGLQAEAGQKPEVHDYLQSVLTQHDQLHQGWLLAGGPGSGKSTVLGHFEMTRASDTLLQSESGMPELCIWMHLGDYRVGAQQQLPEPDAWLADKWDRRYPQLPGLQTLGKQYRLRFLLDGVNEIEPGAGISRRQAEQRWATWAADVAVHHLPPVFSVRPLEYHDGLKSASFCVTEIRLMHWQSSQIKSFIENRQRVSASPGIVPLNGLWEAIEEQLQQDPTLEQFHGLPMNLDQQCELYETLGRLVTQRAELYSGILCLRLQRAQQMLDDHSLLGSVYSVRSLNDGSWQKQLPSTPLVSLLLHLEQLALAMQSSIVVDLSVLENSLGKHFDAVMQCLEALHLGSIQAGQFRFVHQSWREYFAARALVKLPGSQWPDCRPADWQKDLTTELAELLPLERLSDVDYSPWAETGKLMLQLQQPEQREDVLDYLIQQHPALAARAAVPLKQSLPAESIKRLQQKLLSQCRNSTVDLRQRIDDGLALGELGDPRYQWAQSEDGVAYLMPHDEYFVEIPAGDYPVGSNEADAHEDERMQDNSTVAKLSIGTFQLSFAPVTNAEYACFIRAGGYEDERWWTGVADAWWRGDNAQTESIELYKSLRSDIQQAGDASAGLKYLGEKYPGLAASQIEGLLPLLEMTDGDFEQWLQDNFGASKHRLPTHWTDQTFSSPSQPVVGISWYEARAYCLWLTWVSGKPVRLPTEAEWQSAAAGVDNRRWPWGQQPQAPQLAENWRCNAEATHVRATTPVGVFPQSDTPGDCALVDMAGNVQEWCSSAWCESVDPDVVNCVDDASDANRVQRGGSWFYLATFCRASYRGWNRPDHRVWNVGFRVGLFPVHSCQTEKQQNS